MVSGIAYFVRDWRLYLKLCGGAEFIYVVYFFIIDETPQWLIANNKIEEAKKLIKKIKSMGGRSIDNIEDSPMLKLNENTSLGMWETFKTILKLPKLLIRLAILCLAWLIVVMTYYTIALNLNSLSGNRFINIMFGGIVEICNVTLFCLFVETRGRRDTFIGTMFLCGLGIAINPFLIASHGQLSVATTMFSKLMVGIAFAVLYVYPGELFPTNLRQTIFGICNMFGRTGGLISPFLIYSSDSGNILGPSLATAGIILLTSSLFFCLPKTKANKLPQSVEDALKLQASVICCRNNERNTEVKVGCEEGTNLEMEKGKLFETVA
uniref:Major facilitator superfamily (MFS) profile domain-containing protein n=3 Tax=Ciona intestinalis TaxID=7719 RepID=H2XRE5_CIOIN